MRAVLATWDIRSKIRGERAMWKSLSVMWIKRKRHGWVLPLSVVDNSDFCPSCLTALSTRLMLASQGALPSPHFKQRGFVCPFMCSCSCSWSAYSSVWRCFGVLAGSLFGLPPQKERPFTQEPNVCSSRAVQTIAPHVVSPPLPQRLSSRCLCLCVPGAR